MQGSGSHLACVVCGLSCLLIAPTAASAQTATLPSAASNGQGEPTATSSATTSSPVVRNQAPRITRIVPERYDRRSIVARVGQPLTLTLEASDPDGDPLQLRIDGLPTGASFAEDAQRLNWTPDGSQVGEHALVLRVSDGRRESSRILLIRVSENHPPVFFLRSYTLGVGQYGRLLFRASDADDDPLRYLLKNPPRGSTFDESSGLLSWRPDQSDLGTHRFSVRVTDGVAEVTRDFEVEVSEPTSDAWGALFLPGVAALGYAPRDESRWGRFVGGAFSISLLSWIHRTPDAGPGLGQIYLRGELYDSTVARVPSLFAYAIGFSLALERLPIRRFLIPIYGLDLGGLVHEGFGNPFQATPYAGIYLFAAEDVFVAARAGYRLVPARMPQLAGGYASLAVDAALW